MSRKNSSRKLMSKTMLARHYGPDHPKVAAADLAWRQAKIAEAVKQYGAPGTDVSAVVALATGAAA